MFWKIHQYSKLARCPHNPAKLGEFISDLEEKRGGRVFTKKESRQRFAFSSHFLDFIESESHLLFRDLPDSFMGKPQTLPTTHLSEPKRENNPERKRRRRIVQRKSHNTKREQHVTKRKHEQHRHGQSLQKLLRCVAHLHDCPESRSYHLREAYSEG